MEEIKAERQADGSINECIKIPIYFYQKDNKEIFIDEESIYQELKEKLQAIQEKPENFLCIEL